MEAAGERAGEQHARAGAGARGSSERGTHWRLIGVNPNYAARIGGRPRSPPRPHPRSPPRPQTRKPPRPGPPAHLRVRRQPRSGPGPARPGEARSDVGQPGPARPRQVRLPPSHTAPPPPSRRRRHSRWSGRHRPPPSQPRLSELLGARPHTRVAVGGGRGGPAGLYPDRVQCAGRRVQCAGRRVQCAGRHSNCARRVAGKGAGGRGGRGSPAPSHIGVVRVSCPSESAHPSLPIRVYPSESAHPSLPIRVGPSESHQSRRWWGAVGRCALGRAAAARAREWHWTRA